MRVYCIYSAIPEDASQLSFDADFTEQNCAIRHLEHVQLVLNLTYAPRRLLQLDLISPANTRSHMLMGRNMDNLYNDIKMFPTMTLHNWGESAVGKWQIKFLNNGPPANNPGQFTQGVFHNSLSNLRLSTRPIVSTL